MQIRAVVDQINSGKALLLVSPDERHSIIWPVELLPKEVREADILYIDVNIDDKETEDLKTKARERIARLVKRTQEMDRQKNEEKDE